MSARFSLTSLRAGSTTSTSTSTSSPAAITRLCGWALLLLTVLLISTWWTDTFEILVVQTSSSAIKQSSTVPIDHSHSSFIDTSSQQDVLDGGGDNNGGDMIDRVVVPDDEDEDGSENTTQDLRTSTFTSSEDEVRGGGGEEQVHPDNDDEEEEEAGLKDWMSPVSSNANHGGKGWMNDRKNDTSPTEELRNSTQSSGGNNNSSAIEPDIEFSQTNATTTSKGETIKPILNRNESSEAAINAQAVPYSEDQDPPGFKKPLRVYSNSYVERGRPMSDADKQELTEKWGTWLVPLEEDSYRTRPTNDFYAQYPNRDIPYSQFPSNAWQRDQEYLSQFLTQGLALVQRSMEAILTEYGHGLNKEPTKSIEERSKSFRLAITDTIQDFAAKSPQVGGKTTLSSWDGLVRRLLHAIVTEDRFVVVMGGHSAAAGHGNHFVQSYTLQIQKILEPIMARLGVTMTAHNIANGGLGTSQSCLAAGDLYGDHVDVLLYDSGMTETEPPVMDLFMRQAILSGETVPFLWTSQDSSRFLKTGIYSYLHDQVGADVGVYLNGLSAVPKLQDWTKVNHLPWAAKYLNCDKDIYTECRAKAYMGRCWINRSDVRPPTKQSAVPGGRASWHPGNRAHQLQGRVISFMILQAMEKALQIWYDAKDYALPDEAWHVSTYYDNMRRKLQRLPKSKSTPCFDMKLPDRVCTVAMQGRTEFTPRVNPIQTSIRNIVLGTPIPDPKPNIYDPPDVENPDLQLPKNVLDILNVIENGSEFRPLLSRIVRANTGSPNKRPVDLRSNKPLRPGLGWDLTSISAAQNCDGSYDSFCGRSKDNVCLLLGHNDFRGGLVFDSLSGWLILNLSNFRDGLIVVKIEDWHTDQNPKTRGWKCENNDCLRRPSPNMNNPHHHRRQWEDNPPPLPRNASSSSFSSPLALTRRLKPSVPEYCKDFAFEFAVTYGGGRRLHKTWRLQEWQKRMVSLQRVVQLWTLLDDPTFVVKDDDKHQQSTPAAGNDVQLAIRATGCQRVKTFHLTHVYWA